MYFKYQAKSDTLTNIYLPEWSSVIRKTPSKYIQIILQKNKITESTEDPMHHVLLLNVAQRIVVNWSTAAGSLTLKQPRVHW